MPTIYTPEQAMAILKAVQCVHNSNNGQADIGNCPTVADGVRAAGLVVVRSRDLHDQPTNRAYTQRSWDIHRDEAIARFRTARFEYLSTRDVPDYEARILARNDRHLSA
jgi:hypothetical protein